jgi:hypothetical protein
MRFKYVGAGLTNNVATQTINVTKPAPTKSESLDMNDK